MTRRRDANKLVAVRLCACGCGDPTPATFNRLTGEPVSFRPGHHGKKGSPIPIGDAARQTIIAEVSATLGSEAYTVRAKVQYALQVLRCSPTLRRIIREMK